MTSDVTPKTTDPKAITPRIIGWHCHGYDVCLDEDGVALIAAGRGPSLEETELKDLLEVIAEAFRVKGAGSAPTPMAEDYARRNRAGQAHVKAAHDEAGER